MITIKSHFAFSGINIPSTINCSIISYFKDDQLIQQINFSQLYQSQNLWDKITLNQ